MRKGLHIPFRSFIVSLLLVATIAGTAGSALLAQDSGSIEHVDGVSIGPQPPFVADRDVQFIEHVGGVPIGSYQADTPEQEVTFIEHVDGVPIGPIVLGNEQIAIRLFNEVFSQRQPDVCSQLMAAGATSHTPAGDFEGPAGFERFVVSGWSAFPNATFTVDAIYEQGDLMTLRWSMIGNHFGDFSGLPATGVAVTLEGVSILRFEGPMIAESWIQYDRMSLVEQITPFVQTVPTMSPPWP